MRKGSFYISMIFLTVALLSCSNDDTFRGSGNIITEGRDLGGFTKVYNPTSINLVILEGASQRVELSADDNIISSVKTTVENGILKIDLSKGSYVDVTITVSIVIPTLEGLENTGSGNITASGFEDLDNLEIDKKGSGNVTVNGIGEMLTLKNSGSGSYKGFGFAVKNCEVANSGSGDCEINSSDTLNGTNSGSGSIFYKGNSTIDISNTGSGEVVDSN